MAIDVYIGFMDEEVRPVLKKLLEAGKDVLVIEREDVDIQGYLFEQKISNYPPKSTSLVKWKGWCGVDEKTKKLSCTPSFIPKKEQRSSNLWDWLNAFQHCMYKNLHEVFNKLPDGIMENENGEKIKRKLGLICSTSMLYLRPTDAPTEEKTPIIPKTILIRSPEMGTQAGLVRTQLRGIFKAIKNSANAIHNDDNKRKDIVSIKVYGAGGAYTIGSNPGTCWNVIGNIYIGVERDKSAEKRRGDHDNKLPMYIGKINYCSEKENITLHSTPSFYTIAEARRAALKIIQSMTTKNEIKIGNGKEIEDKNEHIEEEQNERKGTEDGQNGVSFFIKNQLNLIAEACNLKKTDPSHPKNGITITSDIFMGEETKKAIQQTNLKGNVNMEDFHIFKLIQSLLSAQENPTSVKNIETKYPFIKSIKVMRVDADPAKITYKKENIKIPTTVPLGRYAAILHWGLSGMDLGSIPQDTIQWTGIKKDDDSTQHFLFKNESCFNPFFLEMAQDFFKETGAWLDNLSNDDSIFDKNPFNQKIKPTIDYDKKKKTTISSYNELKKINNPENCLNYISNIYVFLEIIKNKSYRISSIEHLEIPIWARGGWGIKEQLFIVENVQFFDNEKPNKNFDRVLYKANNLIALEEHAEKIFEKDEGEK